MKRQFPLLEVKKKMFSAALAKAVEAEAVIQLKGANSSRRHSAEAVHRVVCCAGHNCGRVCRGEQICAA